MARIFVLLVAALAAFGADDPWQKVKELKSGSELEVWKRGAAPPLNAIYDDLTDEKLLIVIKNEQTAIPKSDVDRIDARPPSKRGKPVIENKVERGVRQPERVAAPPRSLRGETPPGASTSSATSSVTWPDGKADFETVCRRTPAAVKK